MRRLSPQAGHHNNNALSGHRRWRQSTALPRKRCRLLKECPFIVQQQTAQGVMFSADMPDSAGQTAGLLVSSLLGSRVRGP